MIERIEATNLSSWKSLDFKIPDGVSQLSGVNLDDGTFEGSGKSSIPSVITWVLWGKIAKDIKIDEFVNDEEKFGQGVVTLTDGCRIRRTRGPNSLFLIDVDGNETKVSQAELTNYLGMTFDTFCQSVFLTQDFRNSFILADGAESFKILTNILKLDKFDTGHKLTNNKIKEIAGEIELSREQLRDCKEKSKVLASEIVWVTDLITKFNNEKLERLESLESQIECLNIIPIVKNRERLDVGITDNKLNTLHSEKILAVGAEGIVRENGLIAKQIKKEKESLKAIKRQLLELDSDSCPTCGNEIHLDKFLKYKGEIENRLQSKISDITVLRGSKRKVPKAVPVRELDKEIAKLQQVIEIARDLDKKFDLDNLKYQNNLVNLDRLKRDLLSEKNKTDDNLLEKKVELEKKLAVQNVKTEEKYLTLKALDKKESQLQLCKKSFKRVKISIFLSSLQELSDYNTKELQKLYNVPCKVVFKEEKSKIVTVITINGRSRSLGCWSGGQIRKIMISNFFAFSKFINKRSKFDLERVRFLDEPMKDLSLPSKEKLIEVLQAREGSTVLIEHDIIIKSIVDEIFEIEYRDGISEQKKVIGG